MFKEENGPSSACVVVRLARTAHCVLFYEYTFGDFSKVRGFPSPSYLAPPSCISRGGAFLQPHVTKGLKKEKGTFVSMQGAF